MLGSLNFLRLALFARDEPVIGYTLFAGRRSSVYGGDFVFVEQCRIDTSGLMRG